MGKGKSRREDAPARCHVGLFQAVVALELLVVESQTIRGIGF